MEERRAADRSVKRLEPLIFMYNTTLHTTDSRRGMDLFEEKLRALASSRIPTAPAACGTSNTRT